MAGSRRGSPSRRQQLQLGEAGGAIAQRPIAKGGNLYKPPARSTTWSYLFPPGKRSISHPDGPSPPESFKRQQPQSMSALMTARRNSKPCWIIDPRRSRWMPVWDALTTLCLLLTALFTPYEVAFLDLRPTWVAAWQDPLFITNRLIDLTFSIDLVLNFVLMYQDHNAVYGSKWIDEPSAIVRHYLNTWFALDLCSLLPSTFDMLPYALESPIREENIAAGADSSDADVLRRFKFLRVLRCFRLIKLMRLLRASRLVARWETRISVSYASLSLCKMLVAYLLLAHWSACLLVLPTTFYDNRASTWLGSFGYCVAQTPGEGGFAGGADAAFPSTHPSDDPCYRFINLARGLHADHALSDELLASGTCTVHCDSPERIYVASIYLTLQLICGATGGVLDREKFNVQEQLLLALLAAFGALLWGQVIGTFVSVIANARPDVTWFRSAMDQLNGFMALYELPGQMRFRLREYFQQSRHVQRGLQRKRILDHLSPQLQGEVAIHMNQRWLEGIRFLRGAEPELVVLVACSLVPAVFTPGELTTPGHLYTIQKGIALYSGRLLTTGRCWGQDMILARQHLCHFTARAMSYLEVYRLSRATLLDLARPFPVALRRIRWEALRLAMLRVMILTKRQLERQREVEARRKRKEGVRVVLREASDCTPPEAEVASPAAPPEGGTERAATDPPERVWETFLELATETPKTAIKGGSFSFKAKAPDAMEHLVVDPAAVMEVPSLHDLSHGLTHMRGEMEELKAGIGKILERLGGAAPTTSGADPASAHSAPAPAATRLLFA